LVLNTDGGLDVTHKMLNFSREIDEFLLFWEELVTLCKPESRTNRLDRISNILKKIGSLVFQSAFLQKKSFPAAKAGGLWCLALALYDAATTKQARGAPTGNVVGLLQQEEMQTQTGPAVVYSVPQTQPAPSAQPAVSSTPQSTQSAPTPLTQPAGGAGSNSPSTTPKFDSSAYREIDYTELEFSKEIGRGAFGAVWKVGTLLS